MRLIVHDPALLMIGGCRQQKEVPTFDGSKRLDGHPAGNAIRKIGRRGERIPLLVGDVRKVVALAFEADRESPPQPRPSKTRGGRMRIDGGGRRDEAAIVWKERSLSAKLLLHRQGRQAGLLARFTHDGLGGRFIRFNGTSQDLNTRVGMFEEQEIIAGRRPAHDKGRHFLKGGGQPTSCL